NTKKISVNFGAADKPAIQPWNNWLGVRSDNDAITNLKDENNETTGVSVIMVNGWSAITTLGHITGDNSGVFPDAVLESGIVDSAASKQIRIGGLNTSRQYNLVFAGSQNEGVAASAVYTSGGQTSTL